MTKYLMHKLELGEDERVLSQVISEAMSPKRTSGDLDVVGKVRGYDFFASARGSVQIPSSELF